MTQGGRKAPSSLSLGFVKMGTAESMPFFCLNKGVVLQSLADQLPPGRTSPRLTPEAGGGTPPNPHRPAGLA